MRYRLITGLILLSSWQLTNGQSNPENDLKNYITEVRAGNYAAYPTSLFNTEHEEEALNLIAAYESDSVEQIVRFVSYAYKRIGLAAQNEETKRLCTQKIVQLIPYSSGVCGASLGYLIQFQKQSFNTETITQLNGYLSSVNWHTDKLFRLLGYLNGPQSKENITEQLNSGELPFKQSWSAHLALARMGDSQSLDYVVRKIRSIPVNEDVVYELVPDLIYTRQQKAIDYTIEILHSDEKNCHSANPDADGNILCGYRIMEMLAPVIIDFPFAVSASGDLAVEDYEKALIELRKWFTEHKETYQINSQTY